MPDSKPKKKKTTKKATSEAAPIETILTPEDRAALAELFYATRVRQALLRIRMSKSRNWPALEKLVSLSGARV